MTIAKSTKIMQERVKIIADMRALRKRLDETKEGYSPEYKDQFDKLWAKAQELRNSGDKAYMDSKVDDLQNKWENEKEESLDPATRGNSTQIKEVRARQDAFCEYIKRGDARMENDRLKLIEVTGDTRNMVMSSDPKGGYFIEETFAPGLLKKLYDELFVRQHAKISTVNKIVKYSRRTLETRPARLAWGTELSSIPADDTMRIGKRALENHPLRARILVSNALLEFSPEDPVQIIQEEFGSILGDTLENFYFLGTGTNEPLGVMVASPKGINTDRDYSTGNTITDLTYVGLNGARWALKPQYRKNARWTFGSNGMRKISEIVDGVARPIWQAGMSAGAPDLLFGYPVDESQYISDTFTTGLYVGLFCDWKQYEILDLSMTPIKRIDEVHYETNETAFVIQYWGDAMPLFSEGFVRVQLG